MKLTPISPNLSEIPAVFHPLLEGNPVFDSSCSAQASVYYIPSGQGIFLKSAPKGSLKSEALLTGFYHSKGLAPEMLSYESADKDWLLTAKLAGSDCLSPEYIENPVMLCDLTAELLRTLHDTSCEGCPIQNRTELYLANASKNYQAGNFDRTLFPDNWGYCTPEEAQHVVESYGPYLKNDTLLHGDYCLPNIILDNWSFSGFIDLGSGGVGDRHMDLFWGIWSLQFNLKTDKYRNRFLDVYGRDLVNEDIFPVISAIEVFA